MQMREIEMDALPFLVLFALIEVLKAIGIVLLLTAFSGAAFYLVILAAMAVLDRRSRHARSTNGR